MTSYSHLYDSYFLRPANSVYNPEHGECIANVPWKKWFEEGDVDCQDLFVDRYLQWILSSRLNKFSGLDRFPFRYLINGVTQSLDEFHFRHRRRKLVLFRGEYPYNFNVMGSDFAYPEDFIEDRGGLRVGDALILSCPFSATGDRHTEMDFILEEALKLSVPVLIDCAFFGTCANINVDLSHPAIEAVAFSLTKGLGTGSVRSGIEFSKVDSGHIKIQNDWHHNLHANARIGMHLMERYSPDHNYLKYRKAQESVCQRFGLKPTKCIHLALGEKGWEYFHRDHVYNRIGLKVAVRDEYMRLSRAEAGV